MSQEPTCPACGTKLPADAPAGVCPRCLLKAGMEDSRLETPDDATLIADSELRTDAPRLPPTEHSGRNEMTPAAIGTRVKYFGDYELLDEIARGGMGIVYRARQVRLNRIVALKMILAGRFAGATDIQRFHMEAEAAAQLDHPGIVPIFEVGQHEGQHFFSMGLVEGVSLAHRIADGPLVPRKAAELVQRIADAVQYAHEKRVVHRDLKPANILIDPDGAPRVTDFGLAKRINDDSNLTATGQILGTPGYMPPEQAAGRISEVQEAADVYSLGAILYAALTGRPPFQSATVMDTLIQVTSEEPVSPRDLNRQVPRDLATITLKCLRKSPAHRYSSAAALASDLSRWSRGEPILARPVGILGRCAKYVRRHPLLATLLAAVVILVLAGLFTSSRYAMLAQQQANLAKERESEARQQRDKFQEQLWESLLQQSHSARLSGQRWQALNAVAEAARLKRGGRLRQAAIQALVSPGVRLLYSFPIGAVESLSFSADSQQIAIGGRYLEGGGDWNNSLIGVWSTSSGEKITDRKTVNYPFVNCFRPDSEELLTVSADHQMELWNPSAPLPGAGVTNPLWTTANVRTDDAAVFSPDGALIAVAHSNRIELIRLSDGERVAQRSHGTLLAFISPNSLLLQLDRYPHEIIRWDYQTNEEVLINLTQATLHTLCPEAAIAVVIDEGELSIRNLRTGQPEAVLKGETRSVLRAHLSPDGRLVAFQTGDNRDLIRIWDWKADLLTPPLTGLSGVYSDAFQEAVFNSDGSLLAAQAGNHTVKVWEVESAKRIHFQRGASRPRWSPDGHFLATSAYGTIYLGDGAKSSGNDKVVTLWEVAPFARTYTRHASSEIDSITFSPEGKRLAAGGVWEVEQRSQGNILWPNSSEAAGAFDEGGGLWTLQRRVEESFKASRRENELNIITVSRAAIPDNVSFQIHGRIRTYDFCPTHRLLAIATDVRQWKPSATEESPDFREGARPFRIGNAVELWDLGENRQRWNEVHWEMNQVQCFSISPSGDQVAIGRLNTGIEIVSAMTGERLFEGTFDNVAAANDPVCLRFTSDGKHLIASDKSTGAMIAIDCSSGRTICRWDGNHGGTLALACLPDGDLIASGGRDGQIRLWCLRNTSELATWETGADQTTALSFSPDGQTLVSASSDGNLQTWDLVAIQRGLSRLGLNWE